MDQYFWEIVVGVILIVAGAAVKHWFSKRQPKSTDARTIEAAEKVILELLEDKWPQRKFTTIKGRVKGLTDDEIRKALLRLEAVSFTGDEDVEFWGLIRKNKNKISSDGPSS